MDIGNDDVARAFDERSNAAAEMLERSLMRALGNVETELARVVRSGEADLERLAALFIETLAKLTNAGASVGNGGAKEAGAAASTNEAAAAIARAVLRGARFS